MNGCFNGLSQPDVGNWLVKRRWRALTARLAAMAAVCGAMLAGGVLPACAQWSAAKGPLMTRWAASVAPDNVHAEYPRPQLQRAGWQNLNGLWSYAIRPQDAAAPDRFDGQILVPFPIQSALSGVMKNVTVDQALWYRRQFKLPATWREKRVLLHFGGVDWDATVWVNGQQVGRHRGGYDPFSFDVTDALRSGDSQDLLIRVWDPTNRGYQPRGKQVDKPRGIWYTAVTGIWQTAWLEAVPRRHITSLRIVADVERGAARITVGTAGAENQPVKLTASAVRKGDQMLRIEPVTATATSEAEALLIVPSPRLWSPAEPWLYDLTVELLDEGGKTIDKVDSYFGLRSITVGKDDSGVNRLLLNNRPLFQLGPLDQGWWPDGLYTAPNDEALRYDIEVTKQLGFNMCRKHVKIEPLRWYYWCDKLGLMVWQDMPSGDRHIGRDGADLERTEESAANFRREYRAMIDAHFNHPSIVAWVPFNEGWGQFATDEIIAWTKEYDSTRLVDGPSGWADRGSGDMHDVHRYPGPAIPPLEEGRAAVLGEFGGLGLPIRGHLWQDRDNWGYRSFETREQLADAYRNLIGQLRSLIAEGLAAAVYTQTTDVEIEVNGLMTYDRAIVKLPQDVRALHERLYLPPPQIVQLVPTSRRQPQRWRYTTTAPGDDWHAPQFDDSRWQQGAGGFGTRDTPGAVVGTEWSTSEIWIRRTFQLRTPPVARPHLRIHHDEQAEVYLNGKRIASLDGYTTGYVLLPLSEEAVSAFRKGANTLAVHCRQTSGGQFIDVGLVDVAGDD